MLSKQGETFRIAIVRSVSQIWLYMTALFVTEDDTGKDINYSVLMCEKPRYLANVWRRIRVGVA